jgi:hypothetical protein
MAVISQVAASLWLHALCPSQGAKGPGEPMDENRARDLLPSGAVLVSIIHAGLSPAAGVSGFLSLP